MQLIIVYLFLALGILSLIGDCINWWNGLVTGICLILAAIILIPTRK